MTADTTPKQLRVQGTVAKVSSANTIRVSLKVTKVHPLYRKRYSQLKHYLAHDPAGTAKVGDIVTIGVCKPISKLKHWTIVSK